MSEQDNDRLLEHIRQQLDASTEQLDAATLSRLTRIRRQAVAAADRPKRAWQMPALALGSAAAVGAITLALMAVGAITLALMTSSIPTQQSSLEDLNLLSSNEAFELIDDVEFYQWLADEMPNG